MLEDANSTLGDVATNVLGVLARAMFEALLAGETDPATLADPACGRVRDKRTLAGQVQPHHGLLLAEHLSHIDDLDKAISRFSAEIEQALRAEDEAIARPDTIPGVSRRMADVIVAELGTDLTRFPSAIHLASSAGLCPGNDERAGQRLSGKTRTGSRWLRQMRTGSRWLRPRAARAISVPRIGA